MDEPLNRILRKLRGALLDLEQYLRPDAHQEGNSDRTHCRLGAGAVFVRSYFQATTAILRRMNASCVESGRFFGHTSWQASSDKQPKTPLSSPINS